MGERKKLKLDLVLAIVAVGAVCIAVLGLCVFDHRNEEPARPWVGLNDPLPHPVLRPFGAGEELSFEFGWNGAPCADFHMSLKEEEKDGAPKLVLGYEGHTREQIARVWSYRVSGTTYLDQQTLLPCLSERTSEEKDKLKQLTIEFDRSAGIAHVVEERPYKNKRKELRIPFRMGLDLPGAVFFARTLEMPMDKPVVLEVLQGETTYAVEMTPVRREKVQVKAGTFDALAVELRLRALGGTDEERAEEEAKYRKICIWFSDDERRLPVKLECEVFVGSVYAELVSAGL